MDYLHRLIELTVVALAMYLGLGASQNAHAAFAPSTSYTYTGCNGIAYGSFSSAVASIINCSGNGVFSASPGAEPAFTFNRGYGPENGRIARSSVTSCPSGSALSGGQCTCVSPAVQHATNAICVTPRAPPTLLETMNSAGQPLQYSGAPSLTACFQGKVVRGTGAACGGAATPGSDNCTVFGPFTDTGASCTGSGAVGSNGLPVANTEPPLGTPSNCGKGFVPGEINGVGVCLKPSTGNTVQSSSSSGTATVTNPDGSSGGTAPTGGNQTTTDTTCTGSSCTTKTESVVSTPGGGTTTAVQTKTESQDDYCSKNPRSPLCLNSSFSGSCDGTFKGDGDALAAATAEAVNKTKCLLDGGTGLDGVKASLANGTFGPQLQTTAKSISQFNQTNPFTNTCPGDQSLNIAGASVSIPLSSMCGFLQSMGYLAVVFTLLYSTIFVVKGL